MSITDTELLSLHPARMFLAAISFFPGCEKKGPVEKVGEQIDEAVDKIHQKAEDAGKDIKNSVNE